MIHAVRDSVGGAKCIVFYNGNIPIYTLWEFNVVFFCDDLWLEGRFPEVAEFLKTCRDLQVPFDDIAAGVQTLLSSKEL